MGIKQFLGNSIDNIGTFLNLPEYGYSERIAGGDTTNTIPSFSSGQIDTGFQTYNPQQTPAPIQTPAGANNNNYISTPPNPATAQPQQPQQDNSVNDANEALKAEANSLYNQANQLIGQYETNLRGENTLAQQNLETGREFAVTGLKDQLNEGLDSFASQQQQNSQAQRSAYADAIRQYNNQQQQAVARFGGSGSTAQAVQGLLSREFQRSGGSIRMAYQKTVDTLITEEGKLRRSIGRATEKLELDYNSKIKELGLAFQRGLTEINRMKFDNQKDRSSLTMQLLQDNVAEAKALKNARLEAQLSLETFRQQKQIEYESAIQYAGQTVSSAISENTFSESPQLSRLDAGETRSSTSLIPSQRSARVVEEEKISDLYSTQNDFSDMFFTA